MHIKLETNKNHFKQEFWYCVLLSLQNSKTYCITGTLLKTICDLDSLGSNKTKKIKLNRWYIMELIVERSISSKHYFTVTIIFIFNAVRTGKENICNIIDFQWSANDAVGFRFLQLRRGVVSKLLFVVKLYSSWTILERL